MGKFIIFDLIVSIYAILSQPVSRVLSWMVIYLVLSSPITSSVLYLRTRRAASMPRFELASDGVYRDPMCYHTGGKLLPYLSTLTRTSRAVYFCCTFLRVASTGRYPASCSVKPGLSSRCLHSLRPSD